jgi:protease-4
MAARRDWLIGIIIAGSALFVLVVVAALVLTAAKHGLGGGEIGVVDVQGFISDPRPVVRQLKEFADRRSLPVIVLRIDSPGGTVAAAQEIYGEIRRIRKEGAKVVASMANVAASGGYYVAAAADTIVANPGTVTGSIGVIIELPNAEVLLRKIGVDFEVVKSGDFKDTGNVSRKVTPEERRLLQEVIDDTYNQFVDAIVEERGLGRDEVLSLADGRVFTGRRALEYGLVDVLGGYEDAIRIAAKMVGIKGKPKLVKERGRKRTVLDLLLRGVDGLVLRTEKIYPSVEYVVR